MSTLIAIDPGVHACGVALFAIGDGQLLAAAYIKGTDKTVKLPASAMTMAENVRSWAYKQGEISSRTSWVTSSVVWGMLSECVVELPQVYDRRHSKGDPNDLIALATVCGALACQFPRVRFVLPREWKGQLPKPKPGQDYIVEMRARKRLSESEIARVPPYTRSVSHNVWDAVALGLWAGGHR